MQYGYIKVAAAVPSVRLADCTYNVKQIESLIRQAEDGGAEVVVFPELCITGYSCQDLFRQSLLLSHAELAVAELLEFTRPLNVICIVGLPVTVGNVLLNCAVVLQKGNILGIVPKMFLPNYGEFYEKRWFASSEDIQTQDIAFAGKTVTVSAEPVLFRTSGGAKFGVEICEDLWSPVPPSNVLALAGADFICNLSASDELIGKHTYLTGLISQQSARTISGYVYSGCGYGESTQDVVYGGNALIYENGLLLAHSERFSLEPQLVITQIDIEKLRNERRANTTFTCASKWQDAITVDASPVVERDFELLRKVDAHPFIPESADMAASCCEILSIQAVALDKRLAHTGCKKVVIGISGGLDSTLALIVCVRAFDKLKLPRKGIIGITMPGFGTTGRTHSNAVDLMQSLGVTVREISVVASVTQHFKDIGHSMDVHDVTYENSQARERTQILMDVANQEGGLVIGTGDMSELALGWATYNGDHISMYGVNAGVPKTLIKYLVRYFAEEEADMATRTILLDVIDTPISPELIPADSKGNIVQKTEDLVGPYELHDFFLYHLLRNSYSPEKIYMLARHAFGGCQAGVETYSDEVIKKWLTIFMRRFFAQQFKRSCLPDGPKVGSVSLSPRGDWRMPSDASSAAWVRECEFL